MEFWMILVRLHTVRTECQTTVLGEKAAYHLQPGTGPPIRYRHTIS
jgi:hypothetical protein